MRCSLASVSASADTQVETELTAHVGVSARRGECLSSALSTFRAHRNESSKPLCIDVMSPNACRFHLPGCVLFVFVFVFGVGGGEQADGHFKGPNVAAFYLILNLPGTTIILPYFLLLRLPSPVMKHCVSTGKRGAAL